MTTTKQAERGRGQGIFPMPAADYFSHAAVSQSMLKVFMDRRRLYEAYFVTREAEQPEPTDPMRKGTACHTAILEPDRFESLVIEYPRELLAKNGAVSTSDAKAFRDEHQAAGRVVLKEAEAAQVRAMAKSVRRVCGKWLALPGQKEQCIYWQDEITGLQCKARLDWLIPKGDRNFIFDLKTTVDASPAAFRKRVEDGRYFLQPDHYCAGVESVTGQRTAFIFVAVENEFPYACALYELDADAIASSIAARRKALDTLAACLESQDFSEPWERRVNSLNVREWAFSSDL